MRDEVFYYLMLIGTVVGLFLLLGIFRRMEVVGNMPPKDATIREVAPNEVNTVSVQACVNKGGIPILSPWDNRLKTCQFQSN